MWSVLLSGECCAAVTFLCSSPSWIEPIIVLHNLSLCCLPFPCLSDLHRLYNLQLSGSSWRERVVILSRADEPNLSNIALTLALSRCVGVRGNQTATAVVTLPLQPGGKLTVVYSQPSCSYNLISQLTATSSSHLIHLLIEILCNISCCLRWQLVYPLT